MLKRVRIKRNLSQLVIRKKRYLRLGYWVEASGEWVWQEGYEAA
jgi:hypothetical protein